MASLTDANEGNGVDNMPRKKEVPPICSTHNEEMVKVKGQWYCKSCLYSSHLTHTAQKNAVKRWRQSDVGKESEKRYEQSEKGKASRDRYFKSEKYKEARRRYNERLKESLAIARSVRTESAKSLTPVEMSVPELAGLLAEIREYNDSYLKPPTVKSVIETAKRDYNAVIDEAKAKALIAMGIARNHNKQRI